MNLLQQIKTEFKSGIKYKSASGSDVTLEVVGDIYISLHNGNIYCDTGMLYNWKKELKAEII